MIIYGAATRFELDSISLGATLGSIIVRRETELTDIQSDMGATLNKVRTSDRMFIETELAQSTLNNLVVAWGGMVAQTTHTDGTVLSKRLPLSITSNRQASRQMILEGPGTDNYFRRYTFSKVVSLIQTEQSMRKAGIIAVPIEFEVLMDPQLNSEQFGKIEELTSP